MKDKLGFEIPEAIEAIWKEADKTGREIVTALHKIKLEVERAVKERCLVFREVNQSTVIELENALISLKIDHSVCCVSIVRGRRAPRDVRRMRSAGLYV